MLYRPFVKSFEVFLPFGADDDSSRTVPFIAGIVGIGATIFHPFPDPIDSSTSHSVRFSVRTKQVVFVIETTARECVTSHQRTAVGDVRFTAVALTFPQVAIVSVFADNSQRSKASEFLTG